MGAKYLMLAMNYMVIIAQLYVTADSNVEEQLIEVSMYNSYCVCPGIVMYECTVIGDIGGIIVWMGDFFRCLADSKVIELVHRPEGEASSVRTCNDGNIVGWISRIENGSFTSQLNITLTSDIAGKTIECAYDNGTVHRVGSLNLTTEFITDLQPKNVSITPTCPLSDIIYFNWDTFLPNCPATYNISSSNCGNCPTGMTNHTNATCTDVPSDGKMCEFSVQSAICSREWQHFMIMTPSCPGILLYLIVILSVSMLLLLLAVFVPLSLYVFKKKSLTGLCCQTTNAQHKEQEGDNYGRKSQVEDDIKAIKIFDNKLHGTYNLVELDTIQNEQETGRKSQDDDDTKPIKIFDNKLNGTYNHVELDIIQNKHIQESMQEGSIQLTLNNVLVRLQGQVGSHWYQFGLALGIPNGVLEQLEDYLDEDALVELLDYWLKNHPFGQPTWQDVATALKKADK